ncbi:MAG TPA: ATP-dependent helicase C-terminal domain-containing protein, partial [Gemmataceae bacterium]
AMARLPVHPRLARLLIEGRHLGQSERVALAAALLSERDPFPRSLDRPPAAGPRHSTTSDVLDRVEALEEYERSGRISTLLGSLNRSAARWVLHARDQLLRSTQHRHSATPPLRHSPSEDEGVLRALLAAFPDRVARRREAGSRRGVMVGGRGVRLAACSGVDAEFFLCIDVDAGQKETLVRQASAIERDWLPAEQINSAVEVAFDADAERVSAKRRVYFADLVIEETDAPLPDGEEATSVLAAAAAAHLERVLPPDDSPAGLYRTRVRCLRQWMPELQLPSLDKAELRELLTWLCHRCRSFADLRKADWLQAFQDRMNHVQRQAVEREAPERLTVPSGSRIALRYELGRPPVLAVRIQEVFGLTDTPRIAGGRVPVLLHLLGPNYRPQQVTDDLRSFWTNTYPQVRKDLRARYPKHAWPEDPWTAAPQSRPRRRS